MKYILTALITWLAITPQIYAADDPIEAKSKITEVTVFLQSAQVTREAQIRVHKGDNVILFADLANGIDPKSIQAAAPDIVLLNSVSHEINYLRELKESARVVTLKDSLKDITDRLTLIRTNREILNKERGMLLQNQSIAGKENGLSIDELRKAADFFRKRLNDINDRQLDLQLEERELNNEKGRLKQQLAVLRQRNQSPSNDVVVKLRSDYDRTINLSIRYIVPDAGWTPRYDLRAKDTDSPIQLEYRADVQQNTGVNWDQVKLTLSSGNPNLGGTKPELAQWNLYVGTPGAKGGIGAGRAGYYKKSISSKDSDKASGEYREQNKLTLADYTTVKEGAVSAEFAISIRQDVPSGGKAEQVSIQESKLPAFYQHYAVPKLDDDAFLVARVTDWEALNLLPGSVNIFFEGTYVTEAFLDPESVQDTLDFSLGRDKKVVIERKLLKEFNRKRTLGFNRERTFGYEITVRNTKSSPINLVLHDQLPVSQNEKITVKTEEISGARHNEATGKLTWELKMPPSDTQKLRLVFSVKHPKNVIVPGI